MTSALSITRSVGAPRAAFLDFPLGHTTGKPHDRALQRAILLDALAAFHALDTPGAVKVLPYRWSDDESWRRHPLGGGAGDRDGPGGGDFRVERHATPQYQSDADRLEAERRHAAGGCGQCVGAE